MAVSWSAVLLPELQPVHASLPGSAAANACFRLSAVTSDLHRHQTAHTSLFPSTLTSPLSGLQGFHPSFNTNFLSISPPPTTRAHALEWYGQQFASSRVRQKNGCVTCLWWFQERSSRWWNWAKVLLDTQSYPDVYLRASWSWDPDSWWTDEMLKHVILWNVRGILQQRLTQSSLMLAATQIQSLHLMPPPLFFNCKYNAKNSSPYRIFTAPLKPEEGQEL